jgi:enamine deaminase RidA (YjgF/YER057c/UK114 family)
MGTILMKKRQVIHAPKTKALYSSLGISEAVRVGSAIHISGQVGWDENLIPVKGLENQTRLALQNMKSVLAQSGATPDDVVEMKFFIAKEPRQGTLMEAVEKIFAIKKEVFPTNVCAATAVRVAGLVMDDLELEISAVAYVS